MGQALHAVAHLLGLLAPAAPVEASAMFPPGSLSRDPVAHGLNSDAFGAVLRSLDERALGVGAPGEAYRITQVPAFSATHMVRVERGASEAAALMTWKVRPLPGDEGAGARSGSRPLTAAEWQGVIDRVAAASFWSLTSDASALGLDGVTYLLEGRRPDGYRAAHRWVPRDGTFRRLCDYLLGLARPEGSPAPPAVIDPRDRRPSAFGRIVSRVTEVPSGKALAGVTGIVQGGGVLEDRETDGKGSFTIEALVPGLYTARWERPGHPVNRHETQPPGVRWEWDEVVEVAAGQTVCLDVAYGRAPGGRPEIRVGCGAP